MLTITNDGRKIGLDPRLINPMLPDGPDSKLNACVNNVFDIWENTAPQKSTQLIFCDLGVPQTKKDIKKNGKRFSVYDDIKQKLVEKGIPEKEIAFIHDAGDSETKKAKMFVQIRNGEIRVLIGSTAKIGAGTNVQTKLVAFHDLDCPWKPADMTQCAGGMIRQGNENDHVQLFRYVTQNTLLKTLKSGYLTQRYQLEDNVLTILPQKIASAENSIAGITADIQKAAAYTAPRDLNGDEQFTIKLDGVIYNDKSEAGKAFQELCTKSSARNVGKAVTVGEYKGFPIAVSFDSFSKQFKAHIQGKMTYTTDVSAVQTSRVFSKFDTMLDSLHTRLANVQDGLAQAKDNLERGEAEMNKPFEFEAKLTEKEARLIQLTAELEAASVSEEETVQENSEKERPEHIEKSADSGTPAKSSESESIEDTVSNKEVQNDKAATESAVKVVPVQEESSEVADKSSASKMKPVENAKDTEKKKARFCLADLKSEKYAPRSKKEQQGQDKANVAI